MGRKKKTDAEKLEAMRQQYTVVDNIPEGYVLDIGVDRLFRYFGDEILEFFTERDEEEELSLKDQQDAEDSEYL